jgi:hypothetical protein
VIGVLVTSKPGPRRGHEQDRNLGRGDQRIRLRHRLSAAAVSDRAERLCLEDRHDPAVLLSHHGSMRLCDCRCPAAERVALVFEERVPAREGLLLALPAGLDDARRQIPGCTGEEDAALDEREARGPLREESGERAADPASPREAEERRALDPERGEQFRRQAREPRRPVRVGQ